MKTERLRAPELADWALAHGRMSLTSAEVAQLLEIPQSQVRQRLHAPMQRGEWVAPTHTLWIPVPPQYRTWGAPPGIEIVNALMGHLGRTYYIGWLSAAALYGAAHQAPQVFQVAVDRHVRARRVGRTNFEFFARGTIEKLPTRRHTTQSGFATVSTIAVTALDIMSDVAIAGGLGNAATVALELAEHPSFTIEGIGDIASHYPIASTRRLGWVLENHSERNDLDQLAHLSSDRAASPSRLNPSLSLSGTVNQRWNLAINDVVEEES